MRQLAFGQGEAEEQPSGVVGVDAELLAHASSGGEWRQVEVDGVQGGVRGGLDSEDGAAVSGVRGAGSGGAGGLDAGGEVTAPGDVGEAPVDGCHVRRVVGDEELWPHISGAAHVDGDEPCYLRAVVAVRDESRGDSRTVTGRSGQWLGGEGDHGLAVGGPGLHLRAQAGCGAGGRGLVLRGVPHGLLGRDGAEFARVATVSRPAAALRVAIRRAARLTGSFAGAVEVGGASASRFFGAAPSSWR
ncbi:hypothetical protein GCM10010272_48940 [Streptomyces lateritius]|nr:hypothetical protein GCM10010272_48940 [Streptomyces lateritius]